MTKITGGTDKGSISSSVKEKLLGQKVKEFFTSKPDSKLKDRKSEILRLESEVGKHKIPKQELESVERLINGESLGIDKFTIREYSKRHFLGTANQAMTPLTHEEKVIIYYKMIKEIGQSPTELLKIKLTDPEIELYQKRIKDYMDAWEEIEKMDPDTQKKIDFSKYKNLTTIPSNITRLKNLVEWMANEPDEIQEGLGITYLDELKMFDMNLDEKLRYLKNKASHLPKSTFSVEGKKQVYALLQDQLSEVDDLINHNSLENTGVTKETMRKYLGQKYLNMPNRANTSFTDKEKAMIYSKIKKETGKSPRELMAVLSEAKKSENAKSITAFLQAWEEIEGLDPKTQELDLSKYKNLSEIPSNIKRLIGLKKLVMENTDLQYVPPELAECKELQVLLLSGNKLKTLPSEIGNLKYLRAVHLDRNHITEIPDALFNLPSLIQLLINHNEIKEIPKEIGQLKKLETLDLGHTSISSIPAAMGNLTSLKGLSFAQNKIKFIPEELKNLKNLTALFLQENEFTSIPDCISHLTRLETLNFSGNKLKGINDNIFPLKQLKKLDLSKNHVSFLPDDIVELTGLEELNVSGNQIQKIPYIGPLQKLRILDVSHNKIEQLSSTMAELSSLRTLNLSHNQLTSLPDETGKISNLENLDLSSNKIEQLPDTIGFLKELQVLNLNSNEIPDISYSIGMLSKLKVLYLNNNKIEELPEEIRNLGNLEGLYLLNNRLKELPPEFGNLKKLKVLNIRKNKFGLTPPPQLNPLTSLRVVLRDDDLTDM